METKELSKTAEIKQKVQLVKGEFTPSEALDIINALIDEKINFHKLKRLQLWEGDHRCDTGQLDGRIQELQEERKLAKNFLANSIAQGRKIRINGIVEFTLAD